MKTTDLLTGVLVNATIATFDEAKIRSMCSFRNEGDAQQCGTVADMRQIEVAVNPDVCLVEGDAFECAADLYWNWGTYGSESFATIKGRSVEDGGVLIESIDVFSCTN